MRKFWDIIVGFLCKVPYDKLMHFCVGLIIASFFCITLGMKACILTMPGMTPSRRGSIRPSWDLDILTIRTAP